MIHLKIKISIKASLSNLDNILTFKFDHRLVNKNIK